MTLAMNALGAAVLTILEKLLLTLNDRNVHPEGEIPGILTDATLVN